MDMGGPSGGRGGSGGSVLFLCDVFLDTLAPLQRNVHVRAGKGKNGMGKSKNGARGKDVVVRVPPGTVVRDLPSGDLMGQLLEDGETMVVARGGRGGRGNVAFRRARYNAPKMAERCEPGEERWLGVELKLMADVGFLGKPNVGKSTLLMAASNAQPKIADYPFSTIIPNLGVCHFQDYHRGLMLCDIPGLVEGASTGIGMGHAFLRHVQRCKVLLYIIDGMSEDPVGDFRTIQNELGQFDDFLVKMPQVVVVNKIDVSEVREKVEKGKLVERLQEAAGHSRVLGISAATTEGVADLMRRLRKFVNRQSRDQNLLDPPLIAFSKAGLEYDSDDFKIIGDTTYPNHWRIEGRRIEKIAKMVHWEYPEAVEWFGRQLDILGISAGLKLYGAKKGDLVRIDEYDFDYVPEMTNHYIPTELLSNDEEVLLHDKPEKSSKTLMPFISDRHLDDELDDFDTFTRMSLIDLQK